MMLLQDAASGSVTVEVGDGVMVITHARQVAGAAATAPGAMAAPAVTGTSASAISVDRAAAPSDGGSAITSYDLRWSTDQATWTTVAGIADPQAVGSLAASTAYYVQTRAVNAIGAGAWSPSGSGATQAAATVPGAMSAPAVAATGSTVLSVDRAVAPADGGSPITGYEMRWSTDQATWSIASMTTTPDNITGLTASTLYYVQTRAVNAIGPGAWSPSGSATTQAAGDVTAPVLSAPAATVTGPTSADLSVTTNEGNGVLYWVATSSATAPTATQIKAGKDHSGADADAFGNLSIGSTGTKTATTSSLTPASTRFAHFLHEDAALNPSTVATTAAFALPPVAPALTGPLVVSDPAGDTSYGVDVGSRQYWALFASGVAWTAADILTGAGAADFGFFDAASGTVSHSETFAAGLNLTGATLAFVARVEGAPPSALSNALSATVNVNTVAAGLTPVSSANVLALNDNANNVNVPAPVGWEIGDRHIIIAWVNGTTRPAAVPAGYTEPASYSISQSVKVFQRVLDGTESWPLNIVNSPLTFAAWNVESLLYRGSSGVGATAANSAFTSAGSSKTSPARTVSAGSDVIYSFAKAVTGTITGLSGVAETVQAVTGTSMQQIVGRNTAVAAGLAPTASAALTVADNTIVALVVEVLA